MKSRFTALASLTAVLLLCGCAKPDSPAASQQEVSTPASQTVESQEKDMSKFPFYQKDLDKVSYAFTEKEMRMPFYYGNVIYNESTMLLQHSDGSITANLRFKPKKILSVRDYTWQTEYAEGADYSVEGNKIVRSVSSSLPYWTEEQVLGTNIPEPYHQVTSMALSNVATDYYVWTGAGIYTESDFFYGHQIQVSYVYDVDDLPEGIYPSYCLDDLPHLKAKLLAQQDVKMVTVGDSVSEGCSSSFKFNHEPFMHPWVDQVADELELVYGSKVTSVNQSVGGKTAGYTANDQSKLSAIKAENPDVLFIHYGINDLGASETPNSYRDLLEQIILYVKDEVPNCDIVLVSPIAPNPRIYDSEKMEMYADKMRGLKRDYASDSNGIAVIDVNKASEDYFSSDVKKYEDYTANGINHPNDFGHRFYVQCIMGALLDPTKLS